MVGVWVGFAAGLMAVMGTLMSVAGTLVVPRAVNSPLTRLVEWSLDVVFLFMARRLRSFSRRDRLLAWQVPLSLLFRLAVFLVAGGLCLASSVILLVTLAPAGRPINQLPEFPYVFVMVSLDCCVLSGGGLCLASLMPTRIGRFFT